jgi:hypothetical protein
MSKNETYTQVKLEQNGHQLVTFIETQYAATRYQIELEDHPGIFWDVQEVYPTSEISEKVAIERRHRWTQYRAKTDV